MKLLGQGSKKENSIITIGKFDGFHLGHGLLLKELAKSDYKDYNNIVVSLDFGKKMILSAEERNYLLTEAGIDYLDIISFDDNIKEMSCETFIREYIVKRYNAKVVVVGEDFRFGAGREGDINTLSEFGKAYGFKLIYIPKLKVSGKIVSSTLIRDYLAEGQVDLAKEFLGRAYGFTGIVGHGNMLGRTIGFPTANIYPSEDKLLPRFGVYSSEAVIDGITYKAITNIGIRPTIDGKNKPDAETYISDFNEDIYDKKIRVNLNAFIREEMHFNSIDDLKKQISEDIKKLNNK